MSGIKLVILVAASILSSGSSLKECESIAGCKAKCELTDCKVTDFRVHLPRSAVINKLLVRNVVVGDLEGCSQWLRNLSFAEWGELLVSNSSSFLQCFDQPDSAISLSFNGQMDLVSFAAMSPINLTLLLEVSRSFRRLRSVGTYTMTDLGLLSIPPPLSNRVRITGLLNFAQNKVGERLIGADFSNYNLRLLEDLDLRFNPLCEFAANATEGMRNWTKIYIGDQSKFVFASKLKKLGRDGVFRRNDGDCGGDGAGRSNSNAIIISVSLISVVALAAIIAFVVMYFRKLSGDLFRRQRL